MVPRILVDLTLAGIALIIIGILGPAWLMAAGILLAITSYTVLTLKWLDSRKEQKK